MKKKEIAKLSERFLNLELTEENRQHFNSQVSSIQQKIAAVSQVDICFCCDITGSMDIYLETIKSTLTEIANYLSLKAHVIPRLAFMGFRDKGDDHQFVGENFTLSVGKVWKQ